MLEITNDLAVDIALKLMGDSYVPALSGDTDIILMHMLAIVEVKSTHELINSIYSNNKLTYYESLQNNITEFSSIVLNNLPYEKHSPTKMLLSIYYHCKENNDYKVLIPILRKCNKRLFNMISLSTGFVDVKTTASLSLNKTGNSVLDLLQHVALVDMIGLVTNTKIYSETTCRTKEQCSLTGLMPVELVSMVDTFSITDSRVFQIIQDATALDIVDTGVDTIENTMKLRQQHILDIVNPKKFTINNNITKTWGNLIDEMYRTDSEDMLRYKHNTIYTIGINHGINLSTVLYGKIDALTFDRIVTELCNLTSGRVLNVSEVKDLFVQLLVITHLRKEITTLSKACYVDLESELELKDKKLTELVNERLLEAERLKREYESKSSYYENSLKESQSQIKSQEIEIKNLKVQLEDYTTEKYELDMYRRFNYMQSLQEETSLNTLEQLIESCNKQYTIIGGNPDWQRKLSEVLPNVTFYELKDFKRYRTRLKRADRIFVNVTFTSHPSFFKLMDYIAHLGVKADYLSGYPNVGRTLCEINTYLEGDR